MGFFDRLSFGWQLGKRSIGVVLKDKTLMLFPILAGASSLLAILSFIYGVGPDEITALLREVEAAESFADIPGTAYALTFIGYFGLYFITIYFNVALLGAARMSMAGQDTSVADGMGIANAHMGKIAGWALLSGSIGLVLNILESNDKIGRFVAALLGTAWTVVSYFVIPVMIFEETGPVRAVSRSTRLMRDTWGENLGAQFGIGLVLFAVIALTGLVTILAAIAIPGAALVTIPILVVTAIVVGLLGTAAKSVLTVGLYEYATNGTAPDAFGDDELGRAFGARSRS